MVNKTKICLFFGILLVLMLVSCVYANDGEEEEEEAVNLLDFPQKLADQLNMPLFAGQILASSIVTALFTFVPILAKNVMGTVTMGILALSFCIALTWIPPFLLVMLVLMVVILLGPKMRDWIGGVGGGD